MTNLIGISGRIGSGKDTFAKMIQTAIFCSYEQNEIHKQQNELIQSKVNDPVFWNGISNNNSNSSFQIKKFATSLKQMVCILIGCTMEQLEDQEFKNSKLPSPDWDVPSVGVMFATMPHKNKPLMRAMTVRELMQLLGTEAIRGKVHDNAWLNAMFSNYKPISVKKVEEQRTLKSGNTYTHTYTIEGPYPKWIITDMRFPNELQAIKDRGGVTIRISRGNELPDGHYSEIALDNYKFDKYVQNTTTLEDLYGWAVGIVHDLKLS